MTRTILAPVVPVGVKPTSDTWLGPGSVPGNWWHELRICLPLWEQGGMPFDIAGFQQTTLGASMTMNQRGLEATADDAYIDYGRSYADKFLINDLGPIPEGETTIVAIASPNRDATSVNTIMGQRDANDNDGFRFHISGNTNANRGFVTLFGNNDYDNDADWRNNSNQLGLYGLALSEQADTMKFYDDFGQIGSTITNIAPGDDIAGANLYIGAWNNESGGTPSAVGGTRNGGVYHAIYVWQRILSDQEFAVLAADPYAPIRSWTHVGRYSSIDAAPAPAVVRRYLMSMGVGR